MYNKSSVGLRIIVEVLKIANDAKEQALEMKAVFETKCKDPRRKEWDCERTSLAGHNEKMMIHK